MRIPEHVEIRRATADDIIAFYGKPTRASVKAWVALWNGEPTCMAGIALERAGPIAFSDMKPNDAPLMTIWRTAKIMLELIKEKGLPIMVALEDCRDSSGRFMESLGLVPVKRDNDMGVTVYMVAKC